MFVNDESIKYKGYLHILLFSWQRWMTFYCLLIATAVVLLSKFGVLSNTFSIPSFPIGVMGGALGIFVSFRTNSCYQRWWEGRKLWGRLINTSRHICTQAITYLPKEQAQETVYRHIAYVHALRCGLRNQDSFQDEHIKRNLTEEEMQILPGSTNLNHALLNRQMACFSDLNQQKVINDFKLSDFDESVRHLLDIQGGAERIKKTPFPPVYGFLATRITQVYAILLPLCLINEIGMWVIPLNLVVCMAFQLINEVGRILENPFTMFYPALPLSAMSLTIERNLRQALGETNLPEGQKPILNGRVLM